MEAAYGDRHGIVRVSSNDPRRIRDSLGIRAGQKLQVLLCDGRIEMIPIKPMREMRGLLTGIDIDTAIEREDDRI